MTFSEGFGTTYKVATRELQLKFFVLGSDLALLKSCLSLKKVGNHKGTDWTNFVALHPFHTTNSLNYLRNKFLL